LPPSPPALPTLSALAALAAAAAPAAEAVSPGTLLARENPDPGSPFRNQPPLTHGDVAPELDLLRFPNNPASPEERGEAMANRAAHRGVPRNRLPLAHAKSAAGFRALTGRKPSGRELKPPAGSAPARPDHAEQAPLDARGPEAASAFPVKRPLPYRPGRERERVPP
jgi:hypothetical protein